MPPLGKVDELCTLSTILHAPHHLPTSHQVPLYQKAIHCRRFPHKVYNMYIQNNVRWQKPLPWLCGSAITNLHRTQRQLRKIYKRSCTMFWKLKCVWTKWSSEEAFWYAAQLCHKHMLGNTYVCSKCWCHFIDTYHATSSSSLAHISRPSIHQPTILLSALINQQAFEQCHRKYSSRRNTKCISSYFFGSILWGHSGQSTLGHMSLGDRIHPTPLQCTIYV